MKYDDSKVHRLSRKGVHIKNMETGEIMFKLSKAKIRKSKETLNTLGFKDTDKNRICVYFHYYNNERNPFYIGQGTLDRAVRMGKHHRNEKWFEKVKNISLVKVEIIHIDITIEESIKLEHEYILKYKPIANISTGLGSRDITNHINKNSKGVVKIDVNGNIIADYSSVKEAAIKNNCYATDITKCCKNKRKTYKGFIWKYTTDVYEYN